MNKDRYELNLTDPSTGVITDAHHDKYVALVSTKRPDLNFHLLRELITHANKIQPKVKTDKPVVPQFVAEWIVSQMKYNYENVYIAMQRVNDNSSEKVREWMHSNYDTFAQAWLNYPNISIEEEPEPIWVVKKVNTETYISSVYFTKFRPYFKEDKPFFWEGTIYISSAYKFTDQSEAEAVAILINGKVEAYNNKIKDED